MAYQINKNQIIVTKMYGNQILTNQILGTPKKLSPKIALHFKVLCESKATLPYVDLLFVLKV